MINRFLLFIGPARARSLFFLLVVTGGASLTLNAVQADWVSAVQTGLVLTFLVGALIIIGGRMERAERSRFLAIMLPALGAVILGLTVLPQFALPLAGAAAGWVVAGFIIFRNRIPMDYQKAIKLLRKNQIPEAIDVIDEIIKGDPTTPNHYRFRAELLRLSGKLDRARRDYFKMIELAPESAEAYNGLSEVQLQMNNLTGALEAAAKATDLVPNDWVALYNRGMIEDRMQKSADVIAHLSRALELKVPDPRHRALIHVYLARAYARLGELDQSQAQINAVKRHRAGIEEWQKILENEQAATLRAVIGADVETGQAMLAGKLTVDALMPGGGAAS
ncbi:MAG: tetratricopeptide repeat protein [bacterium]|nr:tetratricopeptide repeat protein [bacterium]